MPGAPGPPIESCMRMHAEFRHHPSDSILLIIPEMLLRLYAGRSAARCGAAAAGVLGVGWCASRPSALCSAKPSPTASEPPAPEKAEASLEKRCLAEAIGTAIIVQGGCGVVCASKYAKSGATPFGIAATWGISVALAVYATRAISGAHLNPAVTAALVATGKAPADEAPWYVGAQVVGGFVAGLANYATFSAGIAALEASEGIVRGTAASAATFNGGFGMVPTKALMGAAGAFAAEVWMTSALVFLIFAATDAEAGSVTDAAAPALIGAAVAMLIGTFGPVTGAGMNPARDLGPRLVTALTGWGAAAATSWWVYTLGPLAGALIGASAYQALTDPS